LFDLAVAILLRKIAISSVASPNAFSTFSSITSGFFLIIFRQTLDQGGRSATLRQLVVEILSCFGVRK